MEEAEKRQIDAALNSLTQEQKAEVAKVFCTVLRGTQMPFEVAMDGLVKAVKATRKADALKVREIALLKPGYTWMFDLADAIEKGEDYEL